MYATAYNAKERTSMTPQEALERARQIQTNSKLIQLRVSDEFYARIFNESRLQRRTVSQYVRIAIEDAISRDDVKHLAHEANRMIDGGK